MSYSILLLPLAVFSEGDEIAAKLGRQIPRMLGRQIEEAFAGGATPISGRFLAARGSTIEGKAGFVATHSIPDTADLETFARMYGGDALVAGKFGLDARQIFLEASIYSEQKRKVVFVKRYEIYTSYIFDALEEVKLKVVQTLGVVPEEDERIRLFRRPTESWQALLYYLLAEDERYSLQNGMPPAEIFEPLKLYREALAVDPDFTIARQAMEHYVLEVIEQGSVPAVLLRKTLMENSDYLSAEFLREVEEIV